MSNTLNDIFDRNDGLGLASLVRSGAVSPHELLDGAIALVEERNPSLNAVVMELYDYARRSTAAGLPDGPFRGVPFLLKDLNAPLGGVETTRGSRFFKGSVPPRDSVLVERLKRAGLVIFGKTNTCEMGLSVTCEPQLHGPTKNPWNTKLTPGGSSGGAAAAVAARMVPMAHAADGFGSIRVPAACCGLVGLKPTRGRNSLAPYLGEAVAGGVSEHAVTRSVRDCAALLDATAGFAAGDPYAAPAQMGTFLQEAQAQPRRLRIAISSKTGLGTSVDASCQGSLDEAARLCEALGHSVEEADPPIGGTEAWSVFVTLVSANMFVTLSSRPDRPGLPSLGDVETVTLATALRGEAVRASEYVKAVQAAHRMGRDMAAFHERFDVLLTPALGSQPAPLGWLDMMMDDLDEYWRRVAVFTPFTVSFNLTGQPALVLPMSPDPDGLPSAVQLVAPFGDEATLFRLGAQIEAAAPWIGRRPPAASAGDIAQLEVGAC